MFERLCAFLLRLYPAAFRREYAEDARQLVRDRIRHERGVWRRTRLLMDLTVDLFATALRWQPAAPAVLARVDGTPRFVFIEPHRPRPEAMVAGTLTSMLMLASFTLLFQPRIFPPAPVAIGEGTGRDPRGFESSDTAQQGVVGGPSDSPIVEMVAEKLRERYYDVAIGQQLATALLAFHKDGQYKLIRDAELADRINDDIYRTSRAIGIPPGQFVVDVVFLGRRPGRIGPPEDPNCLFRTIETLPRNIGHLKLDGFMPPARCQNSARRAMQAVNNTNALVIDLRDNGGGMGETALQIAGYLFDRPAYLFDPRPHTRVPSHTASPIHGSKLADKPVYVLTSTRTASAAEYFVYGLKMLKRVTVVGERTAGKMHSGAFHQLDDRFGMGIQEVAPPDNPYPVKGWEHIGIEPDVAIPAGEALQIARALAESTARRSR